MSDGVFIKGSGIISPQHWLKSNFLANPVDYRTNFLTAIEPDYSEWIKSSVLRRMSRIIKMGTAAAMMAVKDAQIETPDGVISGTGYGCMEDTGVFLKKITELREEALNPTPFMQSTHNTIGSQIALLLQCRGYNQTYVQSGFSFEHALLDAILQLEEKPEQNILVGAVDEITEASHSIQSRFDKYRANVSSTLKILNDQGKGTVAGEGASYFVLSGKNHGQAKASIGGVKLLYRPDDAKVASELSSLLQENALDEDEIDLVLTGHNGDKEVDRQFEEFLSKNFKRSSIGFFKHLCGEYFVSSAFAAGLAVAILEYGQVPGIVLLRNLDRPVKNLLIYNSYFYKYHSLILLRSCQRING